MEKSSAHIIFILVMIGVIVAVDIAFFRHRLWPRLLANILIVVAFIALYFSFLRR